MDWGNAFYNRGNAYANLGQLDQAMQDFDQTVKLNPKDAQTFYDRGVAYISLGQSDQAMQDFDQAIKLNPKHSSAFNNRGTVYVSLEQFDKAIQDFDQAIALNPKNANTFYNRGLTYRKLKEEEKAIADFKQAENIDPIIISQEQTKKVEEKFEKGIKPTQASNKKVQEFQETLEGLKEGHQKEERNWLIGSIFAVIIIILMLILFAIGFLKSSNTYAIYAFYIFSSIVTFAIIHQYTNAKSMRIEASNRLVMAKMFERVKQENTDYKKELLPKLADAIVYPTVKEKNNTDGLVEKIIDRLEKLKKS